jgi:transcriptional regulator with XRE-family HTH domain
MHLKESGAKKIFSNNLKYFLELNEKKQIDLANYLKCSTGLVTAWCKGEKMPRMDKIQAICNWLHINMSDLVDDKHNLQEEGYYLNEETKKIAQAIYDNPDLHEVMILCEKMQPEKLKALLEFMKLSQETLA